MFKKILVPLDGSEVAEYALLPALTIAKKAQELILLNVPVLAPALTSVVYSYDMPLMDTSLRHLRAQAGRYLALKKAEIAQAGLFVRLDVVPGDPAGVIIDTAIAEEVDLIVMSTHGYTGIDHLVMGSVTERVLRQAPCPVFVVRRPHAFKRILITLDGSKLAESSLEPGIALARLLDAEVTLLRVREPHVQPTPQLVAELENIEHGLGMHMLEDYYADVDDYLVRQRLRFEDEVPIRTVVMNGDPALLIADYAREHAVDLVVMATHGRTGLRRWMYGSVTEKVLRSIKEAAVLLIRP